MLAVGPGGRGSEPVTPATNRLPARQREATVELVVGAGLVGVVVLAGVYFAVRPTQGAVDNWFLSWVDGSNSRWFNDVTWLRFPVVIVVGSLAAAAAAYPRDRLRSASCLVGPPLALILGEAVVKPLVGRTLGGVVSYPSGTTVGAAALATAAVLATPPRWRKVAAAVGAVYAVWMALAVVKLRWHFPTDALAGLAFGVGMVLVVDGALWRIARRLGVRWLLGGAAEESDPDAVAVSAPPLP